MNDNLVTNDGNYLALIAGGFGIIAILTHFEAMWAFWVVGYLWHGLWLCAVFSLPSAPSRKTIADKLRTSNVIQTYTARTRQKVNDITITIYDRASDGDDRANTDRTGINWRIYNLVLLGSLIYLSFCSYFLLFRATMADGAIPLIDASIMNFGDAAIASIFVFMISLLFIASSRWLKIQNFADHVFLYLAISILNLWGAPSGSTLIGVLFIFVAVILTFTSKYIQSIFSVNSHDILGHIIFALIVSYNIYGFEWADIRTEKHSSLLIISAIVVTTLFKLMNVLLSLRVLRWGLRRNMVLAGLLVIALGIILTLLQGAASIITLLLLESATGAALFDLYAIFEGARGHPWNYAILYLLMFSTLIPTGAFVAYSLLSLQGFWPRNWRSFVSDRIEDAPTGAIKAFGAALGLTITWFAPIATFFFALWLLWPLVDKIILTFLGWYFDILLWIAHVPIGAL